MLLPENGLGNRKSLGELMPTIDDMFPPSDREHYDKANLVLLQVICTLQFPRVLRLEAQPPAGFQDAIKKTFPLYERGAVPALPLGMQLPVQVLQLIAAQSGAGQHQFLTESRQSVVSLTPESLTFMTQAYTKWEDFESVLRDALGALEEYKIPFFSRISLRYVNTIQRETLGLQGRPWAELVRPELIGPFPFSQFEAYTQQIAQKLTVALPDATGSLTLQQGFVVVAGVARPPGRSYMLDFDFHHQPKIETKDAQSRLDHFHELAGRAFRWATTPELRTAMGPRPVPDRDDNRRVANGQR
jgi:uncharacterized protein (TIGR04255 family)